MRIEGTALKVEGANIDTDVLYPGPFLNIDDPAQMKAHLFEGLDPGLRDELKPGTILVVGENFGCGSSREHVPLAMKAWDVGAVIGQSFARIFYRNCINLALPIVVCPDGAAAAHSGSLVTIDTDGTVTVDDHAYQVPPTPAFMQDMISSGGLVAWARRRLAADA
ncbi:MAG: 3-isopropylmalate dehydratase small subunit [Actinobacteria bacterium]|nr:3-isopropylmalate dehydratase small subunit [Actinomycetota bacterium]